MSWSNSPTRFARLAKIVPTKSSGRESTITNGSEIVAPSIVTGTDITIRARLIGGKRTRWSSVNARCTSTIAGPSGAIVKKSASKGSHSVSWTADPPSQLYFQPQLTRLRRMSSVVSSPRYFFSDLLSGLGLLYSRHSLYVRTLCEYRSAMRLLAGGTATRIARRLLARHEFMTT